MNSFVLILPLLIIRFIVLKALNPDALKEAASFAPLVEKEKYAYYMCQLATILLLIVPFFLKIKWHSTSLFFGGIIYLVGIILVFFSTINFAASQQKRMRTEGLYRFSRNPMYVGYFFFFLGCVLLTVSILLFICLACFQISSHWIILSEERWCKEQFGGDYLVYQKKVRRYF